MNKFYQSFLFVLLLALSSGVYAQKSLTMRVINVTNSIGTDCDDVVGICNGSEWEWLFRGGVNACVEADNNSANNFNPSTVLWGTNTYYSAECWPSGSVSVTFYGQEDDGVSNCDIESGAPSSTNVYTIPLATATGNIALANPVSVTSASGAFGCSCGMNIQETFTYSSRWEIGGGFSGSNLDVNGYGINKSCLTALDVVDGGAEGTGLRVSNIVNQCTDAWYIYDVTSTTLGWLDIDPDNNNGFVRVYATSDGTCNTLCEIANGGGYARVLDPAPGRYFIKLEPSGGMTNLYINKSSGRTNNFVCNAKNMGTLVYGGPNLDFTAENNIGSTVESGEPWVNISDDDNESDWYRFTTGASVPARTRIFAEDNGSDNIDLDYRLYVLNDNAYSFPCPCQGSVNWGKLSALGDGDGDNNIACGGACGASCRASDGYWCLTPNTTYFVQVKGYRNNDLWPCDYDEDDGDYRLLISPGSSQAGPDNVCAATSIGTISAGGSLAMNNQNNECAGTQAGEMSGGQQTVWYTFTTGATVSRDFNLNMDATSNGLNADVYLYRVCGNACTSGSPNWGNFQQIGNWYDINPLPGEYDAGGTVSGTLLPNTTYYIRADGTDLVGTSGNFNLSMSFSGGSPLANDLICSAIDKGTLNSGATLTENNFSNIGASTEDLCASNEPNVSSNDETVWFKFTTGANPGTVITVDASAIGGSGSGGACIAGEIVAAWTKVYEGPAALSCPFNYSAGNPFTVLTEVGSGGLDVSDVDIGCPKPNQTYYVQIDMGGLATCDVGRFNLTITDNGKVAGPDRICNAIDISQAAYGGPLSNTTNTDLFINNQSNRCATNASPSEPDQMTGSLDRTTWYKFKTPTSATGTLPHTYQVMVTKDGGSPIDAFPAFTLWKDMSGTGTRTCTGPGGTENATSFSNLQYVADDNGLDITNSDANVDRQCLEPNTWYYIQIDHTSLLGDFVNYSVRVKKDAFKPGDNICDATDLGYITSNGLPGGTTTNVSWTLANKFTAAPYFGLPHTNKCASGETGEPQSSPGGPNPNTGTHTATVWYKFTTGSGTPPDWIYWYNDDDVLGDGNRGTLCVLGTTFNSRVTFYKNTSTYACPVGANLQIQEEMNVPGDVCDATTGIGFGAPCYADMFRLKCPEPNTTYWVQVEDAGAISTCYEGQWTFDNSDNIISSAPTLGGAPPNDNICGAIDLGTVPNGSGTTPAMTNLYDNFCATADQQWRADFTQSLDRDVWFRFRPPLSGSVRVTAQSAPSGSPTIDNDLDIQMTIWEPILGDATNTHCSDPRFLWTPIISQDHSVQEATEAGAITTTWYDIYNTCGNSALCNEGNSLIATCLDPNKYYYVQVDGGDYLGCDLIDAGDCIMGYFKLQIQDAGLGLYNAGNPGDVGTPFTSLGVPNTALKHDEPCFAQTLPVNSTGTAYGSLSWINMTNRCATSINDPIPSEWLANNASTDKTVWARFIAPPSGKVKIRAENISQLKGDADYHDDINLQLALYATTSNCYDKGSQFYETGNGNGFDGGAVETDPLNADDYVGICVPCVGTCGFDEYMVARCLVPGQEYFIMIDGDAGYTCLADVEDVEGDFRISVQELNGIPASTNDSICEAYNMSGVGGLAVNGVYTTPIAFNNECATIDASYEGPGKVAHNIDGAIDDFDVEHTLWFKFVAPASGKVKIEAIEDNGIDDIDLGIAIFDIPTQNCANIQSNGFKFDDDYDPAIFGIANSDDEEITVSCLVPGRTYWVQVDGDRNLTTCGPAFSGTDCETGQFKVRVTHLPADPTYANNVTYTTPSTTSPGGNDMFCQAHQIVNAGGTYNAGNQNTFLQPGETINFHHNNRCATAERNEPEANGWDLNPFNTNSDPTVWYSFSTGPSLGPLRPGDITIRITNPTGTCFDPDLDLYEYNGTFNTANCNSQASSNSQFIPLLRVGEGKVFNVLSPREEEIKITCPRANTRYFLRVLGTSTCPLFGTDQGEFDISISMSNVNINFQTNDDICGALDVGSGALVSGTTLTLNNQNNFCATQQLGEPNTSQGAVQNEPEYDETMWYKFTTDSDPGVVQVVCDHIASPGIAAIPSITVYKYVGVPNSTACTSSPFQNIADVASNIGLAVAGTVTVDSAKVTLPCVSPNTTYYIQVDGADASLWGFTIPGFTDNFIYNLIVRDLGSGSGRALNDMIANALPVGNALPLDGVLASGGTLTVNGHNRCATCEQNEPNADYCGTNTTDHNNVNEDETVWFYFITPPKPGVITVTLADDATQPGIFSPNFTLYYNNGLSPGFRITGAPSQLLIQEGSSAVSLLGTASQAYTCLLPNTRYYVQVDGNDLVAGRLDQADFILTVTDDGSGSPGPSNDLICNAENVTVPTNGTTGALGRTNKCSWEETGEPNTSDNMGGSGNDVTSDNYDETVWFSFVPPVDGDITLTLDPTSGLNGGINYRLYQKTGTGVISCSGSPADIPNWSQLTEIANGTGGPFGVSDVITETFPCLSAGRRYYIQVDGNDLIGTADVGNFNITLTHSSHATPVNDNICGIGATAAQGNMGTFGASSSTVTATSQDNRCATQEVNEPNVNGDYSDITDPGYDHTLWYKFVASTTDGTYNINLTNVGADLINGSITVYRQDAAVCSGPNFGGLTQIKTSSVANSLLNDETLALECWEIEEGRTYFVQVQGWDGVGGGDVGNNFNVAVQFTAGSSNGADNICTAPTVTLGSNVSANNLCATTQTGEPNISPSPQDPSDGSSYDETLWYKFTAPASGEVQLNTSGYSSGLLTLSAELYSIPAGYNCGTNGFSGLIREDYTNTLTSLTNTWQQGGLRCLVPGKEYYLRFDGNDLTTDRGSWTFNLTDLNPSPTFPVNDEPCGAIDVSQYVNTLPCSDPSSSAVGWYTDNYNVNGVLNPDVDIATRSLAAVGCGGAYNCNDYWYKFTVPLDATGIRIQGNDEYPAPYLANNSSEVIGVYRAVNGCSGTLQQINCGAGGVFGDVDYTLAAYPGETLYIQVFNQNAPSSPTNSTFGFCISVDCPAKTACQVNSIEYGQVQCWNMNTNGVNLAPQYYDCLPGSNNSVNYFSFTTDCDGTPNDTVTVVFSVTDIGCGQTAMSMFLDQTPCAAPFGQYNDILVNCAVFEEVLGGTTATNFMSTFILPACATYVMQIISNENTVGCASSGQVLIFKSYLNPSTILPIELVSFTGYNNGPQNILNWTTASEQNSLKYEVEKSVDGTNFYYIGEKDAAGFSNQPLNYELIDPFPVSGNNYYRLKIIDADQTFSYSDVINIRVKEVAQVLDAIVNIYPNPTNNQVNIVFQSAKPQKTDLVIFNSVGQLVHKKVYALDAGLNTITLDARNMASGIYLVNMFNESTGMKYYSKFVRE